MFEAIGELLPLAVGIALSPLPTIAIILVLLSPRARTATPAFLVGGLAAIAFNLNTFAYLSGLGLGGSGHGAIGAILRLLVGSVLLFLAYKEWRSRPTVGQTAELPHWMVAVEDMRPLAAAGLGFVLYALNPKNLTMGIAAGIIFGAGDLPLGQSIVTCAIYVVVAGSTVIIPITAYLVAKDRIQPWLEELRIWLTLHNAAIMTALLSLIGAMMVGKAISAV